MLRILQEFKDFLKEYKVIGLAVAFIVGAAATDLIKSMVNNILMPSITPFIPNGSWQTATLKIGPISLGLGAFIGAVINFIIIALAIFLMIKPFTKKVEPKPEEKKKKK